MSDVRVVIPCYNEESRLRPDELEDFLIRHPRVRFVLVNDGSTDRTLEILRSVASHCPRQVQVYDQQPNQGKAETVRHGMLLALEDGVSFAGYWDADLATPLDEIPRFIALLEDRPELSLVLGSRVRLLGCEITRSAVRHYLGRVFATAASLTLGLPVYDTQCGAKLFRNEGPVRRIFLEPFRSSWIFDVELLARLAAVKGGSRELAAESFFELPVNRWEDVAGSKLRLTDFLRAASDLIAINRIYRA